MEMISLFNIINPCWILLGIFLMSIVGYICWRNPYEYNTFAECVASIGSNEGTIMIANEQAIDDHLTIPDNITLRFIQGGFLNIDAGKIVTINGYVEAGLYQIFEGDGSVVFGSNSMKEVFPEWWGATGDGGTTNNYAAMVAASASFNGVSGIVSFPRGHYWFWPCIDIPNAISWHGAGREATTLHYDGTDSYGVSMVSYATLKDLKIDQAADIVSERTGVLIKGYWNVLDNVSMYRFKYGLTLRGDNTGVAHNEFYNLDFSFNLIDIVFHALNGGYVTENHFWGGRVVGYSDVASWGIWLRYVAGSTVESNKFFATVIECLDDGVLCETKYNEFHACRWENTGATDIEFAANGAHNTIIGSIGPVAGKIIDNSTLQDNMIITSFPSGYHEGSLLWDPANLIDGASVDSGNIAVTGAALGDKVDVYPPYDTQGVIPTGRVTAANVVRIWLVNETGGAVDLGNDTWKVKVFKP